MIAKALVCFNQLKADYLGMFTSLLCAIHCSVLPLFISLGMVGGAGHTHNHIFDLFLAVSGLFIASYALVKDYNAHRSPIPMAIAGLGFVFLFVGILILHFPLINVIGGIMVAIAHLINIRISKVSYHS